MDDTRGGEADSALEELFYHTDRVRLVHWQEFTGAKTAVLLTGAVAVLSFVTGLSVLSQDAVAIDGPIAVLVPDAAVYVQFVGVVFAFLLGGLTVGLQRRKRLAWYLAVLVLPLVALVPLATLRATDVPLLLSVILAFPLVVANRGTFDRSLDLSSLQVAALSSIAGVVLYGTVGSYALREHFVELETWSDSFYYVLVTIATVGYGDITPTTSVAKWFSLSIILLGTGAFTAAIGALVVPAIEKRMANAFGNMKPSGLNLLEDHVLVLGYSDITEAVLEELSGEREVVVVTADADRAADLDDRGVDVLTADPTHEETLHDASIEVASGVVVATRDDARDVLGILAARRANPDVRIVAAANDRHNVDKLREVGADRVISPMVIGGRLLGRSVLDGAVPESILADSGGDVGTEAARSDADAGTERPS